MEGFWGIVALAIVFGSLCEIYRIKMKARMAGVPTGMIDQILQGRQTQDRALIERIEKLEKRIANLESLVIERSKTEEFERLKAAV